MATLSSDSNQMPTTLLDLLSNSLILRHTAPYLSVSAIHSLATTSKSFRELVYQFPDVFRYLDLSTVKSAVVPYVPLDSGGISWRAERMDEALTEDEFYSGPLRGIFSKLQRRDVLKNVQTLVLDGLSVPADLIREIIAEDRFSVRILSVREAKNLNERKLQQLLRYAVRPTRPQGTPKLKGLYVFGPKDLLPKLQEKPQSRTPSPPRTAGVTTSQGAQIGADWNHRSSDALDNSLANQHTSDKWYQPQGRLIVRRPNQEWAETLQACEGIIHFDAVLCRGPRHNVQTAYTGPMDDPAVPHPYAYIPPAIATVALGPSGCEACHTTPEGPAAFGQSPSAHLPLLSPPPLHASTIRAAQRPATVGDSAPPPLIIRCDECLKGRWCERCNKWWDEECYPGAAASMRTGLQQQEYVQEMTDRSSGQKFEIKIGVKRDCFGCGHTCYQCKILYIRACHRCKNEYCIVDNEGSTESRCDWCNYAGRRTREIY